MAARPDLSVLLVLDLHRRGGHAWYGHLAAFARDFWRSNWPHHPRPEVFYPREPDAGGDGVLSRVHAKLIVVDASLAYLGSANFTDAAFRRNLEAGVRLRYPRIGCQLSNYSDRLVTDGLLLPLGR